MQQVEERRMILGRLAALMPGEYARRLEDAHLRGYDLSHPTFSEWWRLAEEASDEQARLP